MMHPTTFSVAPFEHYMLADDTDRYSMTTNVRFWFDGYFEREHFEAALRAVLPEHPLFQVFLRGNIGLPTRKLRWHHPGRVTMPYIYWAREAFETSGKGYRFPDGSQSIDPHKEIGLRLFVREHEGKTELTVTFHHAASDGKGVFNFVEDFLSAYREATGGPARTPRGGQDLLKDRAFFGLTGKERFQRLWRDMIVLLKFFTMLPATLAARKENLPAKPEKRADIYRIVRRHIPKDVISQVKLVANSSQSTLNDILLRDLFMTLGAVNHLAGATSPGTRVTIAVPVCMRGAKYQQTPSSNYVSMHILHVPNSILRDHNALLKHIHKVMRFVKSFEMGHTLVLFMALAGKLPEVLVRFLRLSISRCTAVLTNLGIPFSDSPLRGSDGLVRIGSLTMTGIETLPPVRDRTRVAISINSYDGSLRLTMRYDNTLYSEETAQNVLNRFVQRIYDTAAESVLAGADAKTVAPMPAQSYPTAPSR